MPSSINKVVVLAGGFGTRLSEETDVRPKPMVEIGGRPILWHILKIYSHFGITEFIICLGYRGYLIKEFFQNYFLHTSDITFDFSTNQTIIHNKRTEPWKVTLVETGTSTQTGGRIKRIASYVGDEHFCLTYGDGVADVDISALLAFHRLQGREATITVVRPPGRFGAVEMDGTSVHGFQEKPEGEAGWINAGFFVLSPKIFALIENDETVWERGPLEALSKTGQLAGFKHHGFWQPMDTLRDKQHLEGLWSSGKAPWCVWQ